MGARLILAAALAGLLALGTPVSAQQSTRSPRPSLGILVQPPAAGNQQDQGVTVRAVSPEGPAGKAGIKQGDTIVKAGKHDVKNFDELQKVLEEHKPGDKVDFTVRRDGKDRTVSVTLGRRGAAVTSRFAPPGESSETPAPRQRREAYLGIQADALTPDLQQELGVKADHGAVVADVLPDSPAAHAGLRRGDVIVSIEGKAINDLGTLRDAVRAAGPGKTVTLQVARRDKTREVKVKLEAAPRGSENPLPFGPGGQGGFGGFPPQGGFGGFGNQGFPRMPGFGDQERIRQLEHQVQELQRRLDALEKKQGGSSTPQRSK